MHGAENTEEKRGERLVTSGLQQRGGWAGFLSAIYMINLVGGGSSRHQSWKAESAASFAAAGKRERRQNGAQVARKKGRSAPQMLAINKSLMGADIALPRSQGLVLSSLFSPTEIIDADNKKSRHSRKTFRPDSFRLYFQGARDASPQKQPHRFDSRSPTSSYIREGKLVSHERTRKRGGRGIWS